MVGFGWFLVSNLLVLVFWFFGFGFGWFLVSNLLVLVFWFFGFGFGWFLASNLLVGFPGSVFFYNIQVLEKEKPLEGCWSRGVQHVECCR